MKKILRILSRILLIISFLVVAIIIVINLITIIRIMFFGMTVGSNEYPDTIWWGKTILHGLSGIKAYYHVFGELVYMYEIPISVVCIMYQVIYFKIIRKNISVWY